VRNRPLPRILRETAAGAEPFSLADFDERARQIIAAAEERSELITAEAKQRADRMRAAAREEGLAQGREEGAAAGREEGIAAGREETISKLREEGASALAALEEVLRELESRRTDLLRTAGEDMLRFAIAVAEKIVLHEIGRQPARLNALVLKGVRLVGAKSDITVEMSSEDLKIVGELSPELKALAGAEATIALVPNAHMPRGGCRVRGAGVEADVGIHTQLERIREALLGEQGK